MTSAESSARILDVLAEVAETDEVRTNIELPLFGVHTPENFNLPFLAPNIRDFWNRWHISLSFWFRDHV